MKLDVSKPFELKEKFEQAFQLRTVLEQTFAPHYQAAAVNLRSLFQAAAQANFKADELQQSMQRVLSSLNYKLLSGIRLHDQSEAYRQQWRQLFQSAQQDRSALMLFLSQFERYFTELDDDSLGTRLGSLLDALQDILPDGRGDDLADDNDIDDGKYRRQPAERQRHFRQQHAGRRHAADRSHGPGSHAGDKHRRCVAAGNA